jgi:hypothetical protein
MDNKKITKEQLDLEKLATQNCLLRVVSGSNAYGTALPTSDWDERGIFLDKIERVVLPFEKVEFVKFSNDDIVYYELSKYMPLLLDQNPNMIELLWTEEKDILFKNDFGQLLIDNRAKFLCKKIKNSYIGYAKSQLARIKGHNKWINSPQPEKEPKRKDFVTVVWNNTNYKEFNKYAPQKGFVGFDLGDNHFGLFEHKKIGLEKDTWFDEQGNLTISSKEDLYKLTQNNKVNPDLIVKINQRSFEEAHKNWKCYWDWKKNRNEKRSILEEQFGYDTKHAMHLIRLLRSGADILEYGIVPVKRNDAQYLLDIRLGKFTYEEIIAESERLYKRVEYLSSLTKLNDEPDYKLAKDIMLEIYTKQWNMSVSNILSQIKKNI